MKQLYRSAYLLFFLFTFSRAANAQQVATPTVDVTLKQVPLPAFIQELARQTTYSFFYNPADADSVVVTVAATQQPLDTVLRRALAPTRIRFAIDPERRVYLTKNQPIQTQLPFGASAAPLADATISAPSSTKLVGTGKPGAAGQSVLKRQEIGERGAPAATRLTLAGHVRNLASGEPVPGATVFVDALSVGTATDQFGYYSLTLPSGQHTLGIRGVGIKTAKRHVLLHSSGQLEIEVEEGVTSLREVVISAGKDRNVAGMQMGLERLDIRTMRQIPTAFGETDVLRVVLTLPGVKSVGEGSTGLNVRGGGTDQNLILFNDATVYNPSHLFGFFSAFNPDVIKSVELYKSAIPAKYGGRLSSVLDITTRDGNKKKFSGSGGIGLLTSRLSVEGPILKDKASFLVAGRSSYSDWLLQRIPNKGFRESSASFYDLNAHLSADVTPHNSVYATGYLSRDKFRLSADTVYQYQNLNASLKWKHIFSNNLYSVVTGAVSRYQYNITNTKNPVNAAQLAYDINQATLNADFSYFRSNKHTLEFGVNSSLYNIQPGSLRPVGPESLIKPEVLSREQGLESALYLADRYDITARLSLSVGLRYSLYYSLGPRTINQYQPGQPKTEGTVTDTLSYRAGQVAATYHGPEYRATLKYALTDRASVKASYNRTRQYIHMLSNTTAISPTDIWKLSDPNVRPQVGDQYALGYYRNLKNNTIESSVEVYYKSMRDFVDYKGGAVLLLNRHIETDIINAYGKAYGVEVMLKKTTGKLNGWVSYTYSRSLVRVNTGTPSQQINNGRYYPSNFDKPHDATLIGNYRFSHRFSTSLNITYSTGRPITLPLARYFTDGAMRVYYSERNAYRVPDYYRADFAMNIEGGHKAKKLAHSSWSIAVYNLTGRRNPYSVYYKVENGQIRGYKLSIFGSPIPSVTYNFKF
ncbi:TonB-dependent receptor [Hymenobacter sp. HSC-4F20]|uniref:TonB-dependent receptor n=1 Tax=Hymenobacter sp. HSC-4F20 TaxID=2864135 RepID=UPI001C739EE8|nr:TonB-dependent receptor [Hymenobacter sp. HSC-4F20]MBX0288931.1 TonB-dependent receptor [Hymenobacter sp. HSC-4F20]